MWDTSSKEAILYGVYRHFGFRAFWRKKNMQFYSVFLLKVCPGVIAPCFWRLFYRQKWRPMMESYWFYRHRGAATPSLTADSGTTPVSLKEPTRTLHRYPLFGKMLA